MTRVLEVTLWDYDEFSTNDFLGEVLIDLSVASLRNDPVWFTLTDMDEDSPVRAVRPNRIKDSQWQKRFSFFRGLDNSASVPI